MGKGKLGIVVAVGVGVGIAVWPRHPRPVPTTRPSPVVTTQPATRPARPPRPVYATYMDAVRSANPAVAATQPLGVPVEFEDAAHVVLHDPVYVDPAGNLWITRPDGTPLDRLLTHMPDGPEYVVRDRPVFVHWGTDDGGKWAASVVVPASAGGGFDLIDAANGRQHLCGGRPFRWACGESVPALNRFVVPTDVGVSVFDVGPTPAEHYHPLPGCTPHVTNPPVTVLDSRGVLAWAPWEQGRPGSGGVSRFVDGNWTDLPTPAWPAKPVQLCVLLDGSVLRIAAGGPPPARPPAAESLDLDTPATAPAVAPPPAGPSDAVTLSIAQLDPATMDDQRVAGLIAQLSDPDPDKRQAAYDELARYGPALWPVLERAAGEQPPEGQVRIRQLLRGKVAPALGGMVLTDNRLTVAGRQPDGLAVMFAPAGVQVPTDRADDPQVVNPAWLAVHPDGRVDRPLSPNLVKDQRADACTLRAAGSDEWLVLDDAGPRRFFGNALVPLLPPAERRFTELVAIAARHRWVFRDPKAGDTLILDPTIADPTPRLPTWVINVSGHGSMVGWDDHDNPVVRYGAEAGPNAPPPPADAAGGRFALMAEGWSALGPTDAVHTEMPEPASRPTTGPALLLKTADGTTYFDGRAAIEQVDPAGHHARWPLPPVAVGTAGTDPVLIRTDDGLLFLYNAPGRLLRIRPTPTGAEPFRLEATFTADLPDADHPARVWLDPSGRIDFVCDGHQLTVTFPSGRMPKAIADMKPGEHGG